MAMLYLRNKPIGAISSGASGGGHTIENPSGTDMTQRSNLQFTDADVSDDSTNDRTEISIVRKLTQAEFDELTPEEQNRGVIVIKDANPIYVPSNNAVSVTADGVKTAGELLLSLYHLVDFSKVTNDATLVFNNANGTIYYLSIGRKDSNKLYFYGVFNADTATEHNLIVTVDGTTALFENCMSKASSPYVSFQDYSSVVLDDGTTITLYYNSITKVIESCDAEDTFYDNTVSGLSAIDVQNAIDEVATLSEKQTITLNSGFEAVNLYGGCFYRKRNTTVEVNLSLGGAQNTDWATIGTLPSGYRPTFRAVGSAVGFNGSGIAVAMFYVQPDGQIVIKSTYDWLYGRLYFETV